MKKIIYLFIFILMVTSCKKEKDDNFEEITIQISGYLLPEKEVDLPITYGNLPFEIEGMIFQYINPLGDTISVNGNSNEKIKIKKGTNKIKIKILSETDLNVIVYIKGCVDKIEDIDIKNYSGVSVGIPEINVDGTINTTIDILGKHIKYIDGFDDLGNNILIENGIFEKYETEIPVKYLIYNTD